MAKRSKLNTSARRALNRAIKRGTIKRPAKCSVPDCYCVSALSGKPYRTTGHHFDYTRKLDVIWLCGDCHKRYHNADERDPFPLLIHYLIMEKFPDVTAEEVLRLWENAWC